MALSKLVTLITGGFVSALEYSAGIKAEVVGKPESSFFLSAVAELDVQPDQCVMIGDVSGCQKHILFNTNFLFAVYLFMILGRGMKFCEIINFHNVVLALWLIYEFKTTAKIKLYYLISLNKIQKYIILTCYTLIPSLYDWGV